jgi:hypothetical protein
VDESEEGGALRFVTSMAALSGDRHGLSAGPTHPHLHGTHNAYCANLVAPILTRSLGQTRGGGRTRSG